MNTEQAIDLLLDEIEIKENRKKRFQPKRGGRVVYRCGTRRPWMLEQRYESMTEAAADIGVAVNAIRNAVNNRTRCAGWYWRYTPTAGDWRPNKRTRNAPVTVWIGLDEMRFPNLLAACSQLGLTRRQLETRHKNRRSGIAVIMGRC